MTTTQYQLSTRDGEAAQPLLPAPEVPAPVSTAERDPVRILVYGSYFAVRQTIHQLQVLGYVDHFRWNPIVQIPPSGIYIGPEVAATYSFLMREP